MAMAAVQPVLQPAMLYASKPMICLVSEAHHGLVSRLAVSNSYTGTHHTRTMETPLNISLRHQTIYQHQHDMTFHMLYHSDKICVQARVLI